MSFSSSDSTLEIAPPSALELLWINHRHAVLMSIAGVVIVAAIILSVIYFNNQSRIASETMLSNATDDLALQSVISKYPQSPAAADAMLLLAASLRNQGKMQESDELYSRFAESFPNSPIAVSGMIGRASNARVAGKSDATLSSYQQIVAAYPQSYGAPFALFSEIQMMAQAGKTGEAKKIFQTLVSQYQGSACAQAFGGGSTANQNEQ